MRVEYFENGDLAIFNELHFRKDKKTGYYLNSTIQERLHVYVWEYYNGKRPKYYEVHHKKGKSNNDVEDLQLLSKSEHMKLHGRIETDKRKEEKRINLEQNARPKATEWHKSEEGRKWHKEHYKRTKAKLHIKHKKVCDYCNKVYETTNSESRFCSNACKSAWRRKEGLDNETRTCIYCNKEFVTNKYSKVITCSRSCGSKIAYQNRNIK